MPLNELVSRNVSVGHQAEQLVPLLAKGRGEEGELDIQAGELRLLE